VRYCGIILAKENSKRFPGKNYADLNGCELWRHAYFPLNEYCNTYVFNKYNRTPAQSLNDEPIFSALQWAYKNLPVRYDAIINILANCPEHTVDGIKKAVKMFEDLELNELRSFNKEGTESGLMILKESYLLNRHEISTYQGFIQLESKEIHYKEDLCQLKK